MKALILAAGVGSRLRPLTDTTPKALIEIEGSTMLELVARRLKAAGVTELVVNAHHHAQKVADFLRAKEGFGLRVEVSREDELLLDTGGGLKKASWFFDDSKPFLVHNVDVLSDIDLSALIAAHQAAGALATLAMHDRPSRRKLLFSRDGRLLGRATETPPPGTRALAFSGVYAVSPALFPLLKETGVFSITDALARLAAEGREIRSFLCAGYWADIGDPSKLEAARRRARARGLPA